MHCEIQLMWRVFLQRQGDLGPFSSGYPKICDECFCARAWLCVPLLLLFIVRIDNFVRMLLQFPALVMILWIQGPPS